MWRRCIGWCGRLRPNASTSPKHRRRSDRTQVINDGRRNLPCADFAVLDFRRNGFTHTAFACSTQLPQRWSFCRIVKISTRNRLVAASSRGVHRRRLPADSKTEVKLADRTHRGLLHKRFFCAHAFILCSTGEPFPGWSQFSSRGLGSTISRARCSCWQCFSMSLSFISCCPAYSF